MKSRWMKALAVAVLSCAAACGDGIDVKQAVVIDDVSGGWFDAGIHEGRNKLVPSVTFRVRKSINDEIRPLALNVAFKKVTASGDEDFDDVFVQSVKFAEGNRSAPLTLRTEGGHTGEPPQTRIEMLQHKQFQDMRVVIFAKHSSSNWVELARYDIPRSLLTR